MIRAYLLAVWLSGWLCFPLVAANVQIACGNVTSTDIRGEVWTGDYGGAGGFTWASYVAQIAGHADPLLGMPYPYNGLRYSNGTAPLTYNQATAVGSVTLTFLFIEPNKTAAGQRVFSIAVNGALVVQNLDLFAVTGLLKPYTQTVTVASAGTLAITFTAVPGKSNAVISGIQVTNPPVTSDDVSGQCEDGLRISGAVHDLGGLFPDTYNLDSCMNLFTVPLRISRIHCMSNIPGPTVELQAYGPNIPVHTLTMVPTACTPDGNDGTLIANPTYAPGETLRFVITIPAADPTLDLARAVEVGVLRTSTNVVTAPALIGLDRCSGSGPGWNCEGLLRATINGQPQVFGVSILPADAPGVTWTPVK